MPVPCWSNRLPPGFFPFLHTSCRCGSRQPCPCSPRKPLLPSNGDEGGGDDYDYDDDDDDDDDKVNDGDDYYYYCYFYLIKKITTTIRMTTTMMMMIAEVMAATHIVQLVKSTIKSGQWEGIVRLSIINDGLLHLTDPLLVLGPPPVHSPAIKVICDQSQINSFYLFILFYFIVYFIFIINLSKLLNAWIY